MTSIACGGADDIEATEDSELRTLHLPASGTATFTLNATKTADLALVVDCHPPADPDTVGPSFALSASTLGISSSEPHAGRFVHAGQVPAGKHVLTFSNIHGPATCSIKTTATKGTCGTWTETRSTNTGHTHIAVGKEASNSDALPASGNHWGAWAKWGSVYDRPVKRGFLLHNLEHGGLVFSYKCSSATASKACTAARDQLVGVANDFGQARVIVTPDPTQPAMFAVRAWRESYSSDCFDDISMLAFAHAHFRHGREDEDSDPPIPFDPTGTNVPCQDLMAAPDSCN